MLAALAAASRCKSKLRLSTFLRYRYSCHCFHWPKPDIICGLLSANHRKSLHRPLRNYHHHHRVFLSTQQCTSGETPEAILSQVLSAREDSLIFSEEICLSWITKLCASGSLLVAAKVVQSLRDKRIRVSSRIYFCLLKAAGEQNSIDILSQTFKELLLSSESVSSTSFGILAKAFSLKEDDDVVLSFVREISDLTCPRNVTIVNRIILAFAECGQVNKALMIFSQMKSFKCKPDLVTYNTILGVLGRCGRIDEMLQVFTSLEDANHTPDIVSYNTILNSLRKVGRLQLSLIYYKQMSQRGVQPDLRTYTALIESFGRSGNVEESLRLFEEMKCRRICPSIYIYRSLINNLKKEGKSECAMRLLKEMHLRISQVVGPKDFKKKH